MNCFSHSLPRTATWSASCYVSCTASISYYFSRRSYSFASSSVRICYSRHVTIMDLPVSDLLGRRVSLLWNTAGAEPAESRTIDWSVAMRASSFTSSSATERSRMTLRPAEALRGVALS